MPFQTQNCLADGRGASTFLQRRRCSRKIARYIAPQQARLEVSTPQAAIKAYSDRSAIRHCARLRMRLCTITIE
jgi:hypothetical protein